MGAPCPLFLLLAVGRELRITSFGKGKAREAGSELYNHRTARAGRDPIRISSCFFQNPAEFPVGAHPKELLSSDIIIAIPGRNG